MRFMCNISLLGLSRRKPIFLQYLANAEYEASSCMTCKSTLIIPNNLSMFGVNLGRGMFDKFVCNLTDQSEITM